MNWAISRAVVMDTISAAERTIELPTQIPIVRAILFLRAIQIEVTCSAAFATMGRRMTPINGLEMP